MAPTSADSALEPARAAFRPGAAYLLRSLVLLAELSDGDLLRGLITLAIVQANVAHLDDGDPFGPYATLPNIPPDLERRGVSVMAVSAALHLPYETTRRHIARMVRDGHCERRADGVVVPTSVLATDHHERLLAANLGNLRRLKRSLRRLRL